MSSLQLSGCRASDISSTPLVFGAASSSFWSRCSSLSNGIVISTLRPKQKVRFCGGGVLLRVYAVSSDSCSSFKMNLNEYMVTLDKPLGIRFALSVDGKIFVHSLKKGSNAERSRIIMVGDTLKKASDSSGGRLIEIKDLGDMQKMLTEKTGSYSLVLERPFYPFPIQLLHLSSDLDNLYNRGRAAIATWNKSVLASNLEKFPEGSRNSGFVMFSSRFQSPHGWKLLNNQNVHVQPLAQKNILAPSVTQVVSIFSEEEPGSGEWSHGNFPLEEYTKALERSKGELYYNHSLGMHYSKITEQIYVGSCIQTEADVETLSDAGISAVINFQSATEAENWRINYKMITKSCQKFNILMVNYPIRNADSFDMRKKLPFSVGLLLRLLKRNHRVFITCTTSFDRSPACVIAYLHWMTDTSLHAAYNFVVGLHSCKPDRAAIAWATWDLIAMVENGKHDGPATHAVTFIWNGHEGEDVCLVGDFTGNWKEPIKATHKLGPRCETEVLL
ncbi:phosphoglucan phosphatase LSF1, chloroplastic isoform X2 [Carica papaya]|uniref:phosphoglucan phosphatase LSF1, chloroplastic isoform X2 n=1 Tax=Carica papaya TaxID=3649 RepID=UPI000B8CDC1F|nr:phosphoglucan phosphatase LSF1, chloroplastic isoform X2 [Carica papaya]